MATPEDRLDVQTGLRPPQPGVTARISRTGFRDTGGGKKAAGIARGLSSLQQGLSGVFRELTRDRQAEIREGQAAVQARADAESDAREITKQHPELTAGSRPFRQGVEKELGRRSGNRFKAFLVQRVQESLGSSAIAGGDQSASDFEGDVGVGSTDTADFDAVVEQAREEWIEEHAPDQRSEAFNVGFNVSASTAINRLRVEFANNASPRERAKERRAIATNVTGDVRTALADGMNPSEIGSALKENYLDEHQRWDVTNIEGRRQALAAGIINYAEQNDSLEALEIARNVAIGPEGEDAGILTDRPGIGNRIEEARDRIYRDRDSADRRAQFRRERQQERASEELFQELDSRFREAADPQDAQVNDLVSEIGSRTDLTQDQARRRAESLREVYMRRDQESDTGTLRQLQSSIGRDPGSVSVEQLNTALIGGDLSKQDYRVMLRMKRTAATGDRGTIFSNDDFQAGLDRLDGLFPEDITQVPEVQRPAMLMTEGHAKEIFEAKWSSFMYSDEFAQRDQESMADYRRRIQERRLEFVNEAYTTAVNADMSGEVLDYIGIDDPSNLDFTPE